MLIQDWWLYPDGSCQEMGGGEHAEIALQVMLKLPPGERVDRRNIFNGLDAFTPEQIQRAKDAGVPQDIFRFLSQHSPDPRYYAIKNYGWIRIAKQAMNVWMWDDETLATLRRSSYWSQQPNIEPQDMFDVVALVTNYKFSITVEKILGGQDIGAGEIEPEVEKIYVAPRRGMHVSGPGSEAWQYRTEGDNPERYGLGGIKAILWCDGQWQEWAVGKSQRPEHADAAHTCFGWRVRVTANEDGSSIGADLMSEAGEENWRELIVNEVLVRFPRAEAITVQGYDGTVLFDGRASDLAGRGVSSNSRRGRR